MRRLALGAAVVAALFAAVALSGGDARSVGTATTDPQQRTVSVLGTGTVTTVPDTAGFTFGVVTRAATAKEALAATSTAADKVVAALKAAGVAAKDIQTQQVSLNPRTNQDGTAIIGYEAQTSVSATVRNLDGAGALVDKAVAAGADQVSGPSLTASGRQALERQALAAAFDDAKAKAQALAQSAGASLGQALEVSEGGAGPIPLTRGSAVPDTATKIEPGTQEITAQVSVTFALK